MRGDLDDNDDVVYSAGCFGNLPIICFVIYFFDAYLHSTGLLFMFANIFFSDIEFYSVQSAPS